MIKVIVHVAKAIVAIVTALLFFSCGFNSVDGNGNVTTQTRTVTGDFKTVSASNGVEVIIEQGTEKSITVEADENLQQHIKVEVKGGQLKIYSDVNIGNAKAKKITVHLADIEGIESSGGSSVKSNTMLKSDSIGLISSSGSSLEVSVEARNVSCESSSGSHLKATGKTENLETDASSGSDLDTKELIAANVKSDASSGSNTVVNPSRNLTADASSGGKIFYISTPEMLKKDVSSGGKVEQQ
jgi:hypothetical protein